MGPIDNVEDVPTTLIELLPTSVTRPVPSPKSLVPVKVMLPFRLDGLLFVSVMAAPLVLSNVPPFKVSALAAPPMAVALLMFSVPELSMVPPV